MKGILQVRKQLVLHKNAIILHDIFARMSRFYIIYHYDVAMHFGIMNEHYLLGNELNDFGDIKSQHLLSIYDCFIEMLSKNKVVIARLQKPF